MRVASERRLYGSRNRKGSGAGAICEEAGDHRMKLTKEGIAVIEGDEYLSRDIEVAGRLDVARESLLGYRNLIQEGDVIVDVGACLGDYTATFSEFVGESGQVYALEPNPLVVEALLYNMKKYMNVVVLNVALGPCDSYA